MSLEAKTVLVVLLLGALWLWDTGRQTPQGPPHTPPPPWHITGKGVPAAD